MLAFPFTLVMFYSCFYGIERFMRTPLRPQYDREG